MSERGVALVTGVGRRIGIGAAVAVDLAKAGWDVATTHWQPYDEKRPWGADTDGRRQLTDRMTAAGARSMAIEADLSDPDTPARLFDAVEGELGAVTALVMSHAESVDSGLLDSSVVSFDLHFAVNARASWLLIREYGRRFRGPRGAGRILAFTSDHTVRNMPYGSSKGALDRITLAATWELAHLGVTANVINPGPVDTGWMTPQQLSDVERGTPLGRVGTPQDCANLVTFLCSPQGGWINGQLLHSNGGVK